MMQLPYFITAWERDKAEITKRLEDKEEQLYKLSRMEQGRLREENQRLAQQLDRVREQAVVEENQRLKTQLERQVDDMKQQETIKLRKQIEALSTRELVPQVHQVPPIEDAATMSSAYRSPMHMRHSARIVPRPPPPPGTSNAYWPASRTEWPPH
jgi:hypothetical protein